MKVLGGQYYYFSHFTDEETQILTLVLYLVHVTHNWDLHVITKKGLPLLNLCYMPSFKLLVLILTTTSFYTRSN